MAQPYLELKEAIQSQIQMYEPTAQYIQKARARLKDLNDREQEANRCLEEQEEKLRRLSNDESDSARWQREELESDRQETKNLLRSIYQEQGKIGNTLRQANNLIKQRVERCHGLSERAERGAANGDAAARTLQDINALRFGQSASSAFSAAGKRSSEYTQQAELASEYAKKYEALANDVAQLSEGAIKQAVIKEGKDFCMQLPAEQRRAIWEYTREEWYENINNTLRHPSTSQFDPGNLERTSQIHAGLSQASLPCECMVHRGTSCDFLDKYRNSPENVLIGKLLPERGFMSTSLNEKDHFGGEVILHIHVPKGAQGAYIGSISNKKDIESEVLFDCGQMLRITGAKKNENGIWDLNADLLL